jgi:hypothetical protein
MVATSAIINVEESAIQPPQRRGGVDASAVLLQKNNEEHEQTEHDESKAYARSSWGKRQNRCRHWAADIFFTGIGVVALMCYGTFLHDMQSWRRYSVVGGDNSELGELRGVAVILFNIGFSAFILGRLHMLAITVKTYQQGTRKDYYVQQVHCVGPTPAHS